MALTEGERQQLDAEGFLILPGFLDSALLIELRASLLRLFEEEGERAGAEFKQEPGCRRLANLVDKGEVFRRALLLPRLLEGIAHVLRPDFKLSSLNARLVPPGAGHQPLHTDMGAVPDEKGFWVCNSVWMLDDFTPENGATRFVPGSHRTGRLPHHDPGDPHPGEVLLTGKAGTVAVMNAHLWHGGTANQTPSPRLALHAFFARRDRPQQQYQKQLVRPEVQRALSPELRHLLALDDPLNDRLSTEVAVRSGFLK